MPRIHTPSQRRRTVIRVSTVAAAVSWSAMLVQWAVIGHDAGHSAGYILSACIAATSTVVCSQTAVMPDMAGMYGLGWRDRDRECECALTQQGASGGPVDDVAAARARHPSAADRQTQAREAGR